MRTPATHLRFVPALLLAAGPLLGLASPLAAADGDLDVENFYPPNGSIGMVGGGLVADLGLVAPDGMAIAITHDADEAAVRWRTVPPDLGPVISCPHSLSLATEAEIHDAVFDSAGRLVLVGTATFSGFGNLIFALRYLYPDCDLDEAFSDDGYFVFDLAENLRGARVRMQTLSLLGFPVQRVVIAGDRFYSSGPGGDFADTLVLRLGADGELDPSFDGDGWTSLDFEEESQSLADFVVDRQQRIVFGANIDIFDADSDFVLGRLTSSGALDGTFDGDGWRRMRFATGAADVLGAMEVAANGDLVLAGTADLGEERHIGVTRLNASTEGTLVETAGSLSAVTSAVLQGDRKLVLAGWSNGLNGDFDIFALRLHVPATGAPSVDTGFGDGAPADPLTYFELDSTDGGTDAAWAVDLSGGRPVLFGEANFGDPQGMFVARLDNAYIFVDGFESGGVGAW